MNGFLVVGIDHEDRLSCGLEAFAVEMVVSFLLVDGTIRIVQSFFDIRAVLLDVSKVRVDIPVGKGKTDEPDLFQVVVGKVFSPAEGDIASLNNEILVVLNGGLDHFTHNRSEIPGEFFIVIRR